MAVIKINWHPDKRELRLFCGLWLPLFALVAGYFAFYRVGQPSVGTAIWISGAVLSLLGLISSAVARWTYLALVCLTFPIGFIVSHLAMALVFFLVLTPTALLLRLLGYDPMRRTKASAKQRTYWTERDDAKDLESYFRQF